MDKLRIGVVGVGSISRMHIRSYLNNPQVELTAFCDINEERLHEKAQMYKVAHTYTDFMEMFEKEPLDAVSICTWNNFHAPVARAALEHGLHVLCEKPMTMTDDEARMLEQTVVRTGKELMVGFVRRNAMNLGVIKKFVDAGELGQIYYARLNCFRRIGNPGGWFADKERSGGGPVIDLGVHLIDAAWYLMGKPEPVCIKANAYHRLGNFSEIENRSFYKAADYDAEKNDVEDLANAMIQFDNGASMVIDVSYSLHTGEDTIRAELFGDRGGAVLEPSCRLFKEMHQTLVDIVPYIDFPTFDFDSSFQNEIDNFVRLCRGEMENISPVSDGVWMMRMLNGIYESARTGRELWLGGDRQ